MNDINVNGLNHPLFIELIDKFRAAQYRDYGGVHCPNFSRLLMCGRIKSYILECDGYYEN